MVSQSVNFIRFLRRPKLKISNHGGTLSTFSGYLPEEPAEVELGVFLTNKGKEPAREIKVYLTEIETTKTFGEGKEGLGIDSVEIKLQSNFLAPNATLRIKVGRITTFDDHVVLNSVIDDRESEPFLTLAADTSGKRWFRFSLFIATDRSDCFLSEKFEVEIEESDINPKYAAD